MTLTQRLKKLIDTERTVFRTQDLRVIWEESEKNVIIAAKRMVEKEFIVKIAKGYYAIREDYNIFELANLIVSPSYVSLNSALFYWGVNFQVQDTIFSVARLNYEKSIRGRTYKYYSLKPALFFEQEGIEIKENISLASPERAILDCFYFGISPSIDNWDKVNKTILKDLVYKYPSSVKNKINKLLIYDQKRI